MIRIIKFSTLFLSIALLIIFTICIVSYYYFPNKYTVTETTSNMNVQYDYITIKPTIENNINVMTNKNNKIDNTSGKLMLFDIIPIKDIDINYDTTDYLMPCGTPFGIKLFTQGVMVVKTDTIKVNSKEYSPASKAGIEVGDVIVKVNGNEILSNAKLVELVTNSKGKELKLDVIRDEQNITIKLTPIKTSSNGDYKIGLWVRDSSAGIGTVTYYDKESHIFGGLGHGICDVDTGELLPLEKGEIVSTVITDVTKSQKGKAGSLNGYFNNISNIGELTANTECGVFGNLKSIDYNTNEIPIASIQEVKKGKAEIISTINENGPKYYDIEIESINYNDINKTKNMTIKIIDDELLNNTGGIVQGMSGCPIIQDGKIIGAVTHVFINEPNTGYGIFAENMIETAENAS